ncbi:MAG TPA: HU family DNA-binding protein [Actinomycetota bacterium]|nr:HU family DNA-binding protein [Actinomycetota bacterium]
MALNRSKFLNSVAERAGASRRDVEHVWEHALGVIQDAIKKGEDVSITGFGKFKQKVTAARKAWMRKDPFTGEMRHFAARPAKKAPRFLPAKQFKEYVGGGLKALPKVNTRPQALAADGGKAKPAAKKSAKKAAPKKATRKPAKKAKRR